VLDILFFLVAASPAEPPKTVNGQILGAAADYSTPGPATVCMRDLAIRAEAGENISLAYSGIHNGSLRWDGAAGSIQFNQSEIWAKPRRMGRPIGDVGGFAMYRTQEGGEITYLAFRAGEDGESLDTRIVGSALDGSKNDKPLLARLLPSSGSNCDRRYNYGWDVILGDESVISETAND